MKKNYYNTIGLVLLAALASILLACPTPTGPGNTPPTASFPSSGYRVSGAGTVAVDGDYTANGTCNGFLRYAQTTGSYFLFNFLASDDSSLPHWGLYTSASTPTNLASVTYYTVTASTPPDSSWSSWNNGLGALAAPLVEKLPIGGKPIVGNTLTAQYDFQDADGDAEAGSQYQWYRFNNATDVDVALATAIPSATSTSYVIAGADDTLWLRFQVTPMDEHGAAGSPALSPVVRIGNVNTPPGATFPPTGYQVSGAGTAAANGNYIENGTFGNPVPTPPVKYSQLSGSYNIFKFYNPSFQPKWGLNITLPAVWSDATDESTITYYASNATSPPEGSWSTGAGTAPAPTILRMPISGSKAVGGTLTIYYNFLDLDGDTEGASQYQWYSFANSTDTTGGTPIGTSQSYTTVAGDNNKWLRCEVTPVDSRGASGAPVLSDPVQVGSS
jgi:hypothetical protein